jgi:preprotein translocase subunit SecA
MGRFLESLLAPSRGDAAVIKRIHEMRSRFARLPDGPLRQAALEAKELPQWLGAAAVIAARVLGQEMFDVQLQGALALARGSIAEMKTGEGKTLASAPAVAWHARQKQGVHVMTANDYLARRDAAWMGGIYRFLGFSAGFVQQGMSAGERRAAYACDVTYATANEIGFDFLRDRLALEVSDQVHRPFAVAVIDEADSILIDEARVPLVIAGGGGEDDGWAHAADRVVRGFRREVDYTVDVGAHNAALTDLGILAVENAFGIGNLYDGENQPLLAAVHDALHSHALLHRDVDYVVKNGAIEMVDEFKGRIAENRRWPAGLHQAVEVKEGVAAKQQGSVLGSITLQHMIALYPLVCGMTGTAASSAVEFEKIYGLRVESIPTNRPMIRLDHPDETLATRGEKEGAVVQEIRRAHAAGQPVLVGTGSVAESERLSRLLSDVPHQVLNARQDEREAEIVAEAGQRGAVTISTNMAGRGTDIVLGEGVAALGGLYVIGTQKHESRRIDDQLRGRAGRQGDPGCSRFFVSLEDDLMVKYAGIDDRGAPDTVQRLVEGRHLDQRIFLQAYELPVEGQRHHIHERRQAVLEGKVAFCSELERAITLGTIDDLWSGYLARLENFRAGLPWLSWGLATLPYVGFGRDAYHEYAQKIHQWFAELEAAIPEEIARRVAQADAAGAGPRERGAVWTYIATDAPFGSFTKRMLRGLRRSKSS